MLSRHNTCTCVQAPTAQVNEQRARGSSAQVSLHFAGGAGDLTRGAARAKQPTSAHMFAESAVQKLSVDILLANAPGACSQPQP